jgi:glycosyltransferase involved in cell wall biosynthesis
MRIKVRGPSGGPTGYDNLTRSIIFQLYIRGYEIEHEPYTKWTPYRTEHGLEPLLDELTKVKYATPPEIILNVCLPEQSELSISCINLNFTMFEADRIPQTWVRASSSVDLTILPTNFCKETWVKCGVPANKLAVLPLGIDTHIYNPAVPGLPLLDRNEEKDLISNYPIRFLNVQEVVTRKNLEGLLKAWCEETTPEDGACLLLKLGSHSGDKLADFINSYVKIEYKKKPCAPVYVMTQILGEKLMPYLFGSCTHYISASCGEGWGYPETQAGAMGKMLVAPNNTAFSDYLTNDNSYLVDCDAEPAKQKGPTFKLYSGASWFRPKFEHLKQKIRLSIIDYKNKNFTKAENLRKLMNEKYSLINFGDGLDEILKRVSHGKRTFWPVPSQKCEQLNFAMVCKSLGTKCGIGDYSTKLYTEIRNRHKTGSCMMIGGEDYNYMDIFDKNTLQVVHLQLEYQFHSPRRLKFLLDELRNRNIKNIVSMHTVTKGAANYNEIILTKADKILVSNEDMKNELIDWCGGHNFTDKISIMPLGVDSNNLAVSQAPVTGYPNDKFSNVYYDFGFFGFSYFHKGIDKILLGAHLINQLIKDKKIRLRIFSNKPIQDGVNYFERCYKMVHMLGMVGMVEWQAEFLEESKLIGELNKCHAIMMPYSEYGGKASSAAIRMALKAGVPIISSNASFFCDLPDDLVTKVDVDNIGSAMLEFIRNMPNYSKTVLDFITARDKFLLTNSFEYIADKHLELYDDLRR